jgi:hypothetical protein
VTPCHRWPAAVALVVALVTGAAVIVLLLSPVHRGYYVGWLSRPRVSGATAQSAARLVGDRATTTGAVTAAAPARADAPVGEAGGRLNVPLADALPARLPAEGVPSGWHVQSFAGDTAVELVRTEIGLTLRLRSAQSSFALYRGVVVDLQALPVLAWAWKVLHLPAGGDVRRPDADDQAAQVYVVFPRWPTPRASSDVIGYVWDTTAPAGTQLTSPKAPNVRLIVVDSGSQGLGMWRYHRRELRADYVALFGREPPRAGSVALMIDSDDTGSTAEALVGALAFSPS